MKCQETKSIPVFNERSHVGNI